MNSLKSKTILFAILLSVLGTLQQSQELVTKLVGPENTGYVVIVIAIIVAILRIVTTQPLSEK